ncbi:o-succinylbenzoate synthase [Synechococcus elongatus]|uniref:o-succinylbenzoate synthase n=1 Tax=Synechococcus elongatus TaxID=32046 RepID=UPI000F7E5E06|nr:o-succinylbenzoate synthase [Synechococcus elongatus]
MSFRFAFRPYQRRLRQPLRTARDAQITVRSGIWLRLETDTEVRWGEIAPWPSFGSETLAEAIAFCEAFPPDPEWEDLATAPDSLPACQFGFGCLRESNATDFLPTSAVLLPAGAAALTAIATASPATTYKWKIGLDLESELDLLPQLDRLLPSAAKLRLDANGGLTKAQADRLLQVLTAINERQSGRIEWLEQPLDPSQVDDLLQLAQDWPLVAIALDESVSQLSSLQFWQAQGWPGLYVLKPAIAGWPQTVRQFCQVHHLPVVVSSMFESPIGWRAVAAIAAQLGRADQAQGLGTTAWFTDDWESKTAAALWQHP